MAGITFSKEISLGNLMSAMVMVVTATAFVLTIRSASQLEMAELRAEMRVYSTRLEQLTREFGLYKSENSASNAEIRDGLHRITSQITDIRISIAAGERVVPSNNAPPVRQRQPQ